MKDKSTYRGHQIEIINDVWVYSDNKRPVKEDKKRHCGKCDEPVTPEEHDACLGTLPGVMNACCGHGITEQAYLQFLDGTLVYGEEAITIMNFLKRGKQ